MFSLISKYSRDENNSVDVDVDLDDDYIVNSLNLDDLDVDLQVNVTNHDAVDNVDDLVNSLQDVDDELVNSLNDIAKPLDDAELVRNSFNSWRRNTIGQKINDSEEDNDDRIYIISIDNVPYYYENDLTSTRKKMWQLANTYIANDSDSYEIYNDKYIMTNDMNEIQIVCPLDFILFKYSHVLHVLKIDYVNPLK